MLILTRKVRQGITIAGKIRIEVLGAYWTDATLGVFGSDITARRDKGEADETINGRRDFFLRIDEGILLDGCIHVRVLGIDRDRVKIGISAPPEITILRDELLYRDAQKRRELAPGDDEQVDLVDAETKGEGAAESGSDSDGTPRPKNPTPVVPWYRRWYRRLFRRRS